MVALKGAQITEFFKRPDKNISAILIYGPDHGLVKERVDSLIEEFIGSKDDPFNLARFDDSQLKDDPDKLKDEAHAQSLTGGNRAIIINDAADGTLKAIEPYLEAPNDGCLIIARSGDLKPTSKIRKFFEKNKSILVIPCYAAETRSISELINKISADHNLSIKSDARQNLAELLGSDYAVSKSEIEKLCLYCLGKGQIDSDDVEKICGDNGLITLDTLTDSLLTGNLILFDRAYEKALMSGQASSTIILTVARQFQRLHILSLSMDAGLNSAEAIKRLTPPVHFKRKDSFSLQARIWKSKDILSAQKDLQMCEKETRKKPGLSHVIAHRALLRLGYLAKSRRLRR